MVDSMGESEETASMPMLALDNLDEAAKRFPPNKTNLWLFQSPGDLKNIERRLAEMAGGIVWGDVLFTPTTFIKKFLSCDRPTTSPIINKAITADLLSKTELKYFERIKNDPSIVLSFHQSIDRLSRNLIFPDDLEKDLQERGSLKEFDLLTIYKRYCEAIAARDLTNDGHLLEDLIKSITNRETSFLETTKSLTFYHFDIIEPGMEQLIQVIGQSYPEITISIVDNQLPPHPIYNKHLALIDPTDSRSQSDNKGLWELRAEAQLHACRSAGDESRFIAKTINDSLQNKNESLTLVVLPQQSAIKNLILALQSYQLLPDEAITCFEGHSARIRKAIHRIGSLEDLATYLENDLGNHLRTTFKENSHLPHVAKNLTELHHLLTCIFHIEGLNLDTVNDIAKSILATELTLDPKSYIDTGRLPFHWLWWSEAEYAETNTVLIPFATHGSLPPESGSSPFFQETSFLPGNAPDYFAILFPQPDYTRAKESLRLRKYLETASSRTILSYSQIDSDGKEVFPSSATVSFDCKLIDEPHIEPLCNLDKATTEEIQRKMKNEQRDRARSENDTESLITDKNIRTEIKERLKNQAFSATQLEKFGRCPYQYFLEKVTGLKPIEPVTPEINPKHRGIIVHRVMELFYLNELDTLLKHIRKEAGFEMIEEKIDQYIEASINEYANLLVDTHPSMVDHFKRRTRTTCLQAIELEIAWINEMSYPLLPEKTEWTFGIDDTPYLIIDKTPLTEPAQIKGVIDRVDSDDEHQTFSITDYKTGSTESVLSKIRNGKHLQLPIYIEATRKLLYPDKKPVGAFLFSLKKMEKKHGLGRKDSRPFYFPSINARLFVKDEQWSELIETALQFSADYINKIRNCEFIEDRSGCSHFCDFKDVCRYGE